MSGKYWVTEPSAYLEPVIDKSGEGAATPRTVIQVFLNTVSKHGDRPALALKRRPDAGKGAIPKEWLFWTWRDYWNDCRKFAKALTSIGVDKFGVVNVIGFNSPEWFIANTGTIMGGCITAGIYSTNTPEACMHISTHSKAGLVVVEGNKQLEKYAGMAKTMLPDLKALVVWDETEIDQSVSSRCCVPVYLWSDFMALGESVADAVIDSRLSGVSPGNCSTLIYTSGTTGPPKAVMISHDNVTWVSNILANNYMDLHHNDRIVSYLPLSHIAAQIIDLHVPMNLGACTYFCQPDALKGSLTVTMRDVKPTFFFGVPRVWEKIQEKMVQTGRANGAVKKAIATWAKTQGAEHSSRAQFGGDGGAPCCFGCADKLVFQTIKSVLGLQHSKGNFTAAAPISVDTLNYFASLDIPIYEIFGQSECTGPHTACYPGSWKIGTCGRPIYGSKSYSDPLTKELCYKGRHVFMGYMYMPEQTASTFTNEGFLKSGDIAEFDADNHPKIPGPSGFMNITGRIKELIITAGGENIAPVLIEDNMKATMVALSNCMVIGDKRKYLSMLLTLKTELNPDTSSSDQLAADALFVSKEIGSTATTLIAAAQDPLWAKYLTDGMKKANKKTESNAQIVQKWIILPCDFTEKTGELTPTMKLKRSVVAEKYHDLIEKMYAGDDR